MRHLHEAQIPGKTTFFVLAEAQWRFTSKTDLLNFGIKLTAGRTKVLKRLPMSSTI